MVREINEQKEMYKLVVTQYNSDRGIFDLSISPKYRTNGQVGKKYGSIQISKRDLATLAGVNTGQTLGDRIGTVYRFSGEDLGRYIKAVRLRNAKIIARRKSKQKTIETTTDDEDIISKLQNLTSDSAERIREGLLAELDAKEEPKE